MQRATLVIGAASEIGAAICAVLAQRGDAIVAASRHPDLFGRGLLPQSTGRYDVHCDVADVESVKALFEACRPVGLANLVYVAGHHQVAPLSVLSDGHLARHLDVNVQGVFDACRFFSSAKYSHAQAPRSVTLVASIAHRLGEAGLSAYAASKAAMVAAGRSMAVEFARKGIRVNTVSPGWIEGRKADQVRRALAPEEFARIAAQYPLGLGQAQDVADAVDFLSSGKARWITGIDLVVDGGRTCR
ncbi:MAG: SDR family oxidoreductase [Roseateles sp.]|uniref:SDR family NAD(P)-dependent oxidoreductase n=1 Tax=Roseateles sp. TaxID=1971397 RepID=UPI0039E8BC35